MNKVVKISVIVFLCLLLVGVRAFLEPFFYDPLINYFKNDYLYLDFPEITYCKYFLNVFFRYLINTIISLGIIYTLFQQKNVFNFSVKFYLLAFVVLSFVLFLLLKFNMENTKMAVFYIRRFLIQPLFIFVLVPAFYYQKLKKGKYYQVS